MRRLIETQLWIETIFEHGPLPGGVGHREIVRVRLMHAATRVQAGRWEEWDEESAGLPINLAAEAATLLLFCQTTLSGAAALGFNVTDEIKEVCAPFFFFFFFFCVCVCVCGSTTRAAFSLTHWRR